MALSLIVAMDQEGGIGKSGTLPWHLPDDLKFFKQMTQGKVLLMGRKTFTSLPGVLPGRPHWVLSRTMASSEHEQVRVFSDWPTMKSSIKDVEAMVIGGGDFYQQVLPDVTSLYVTRVESAFACDVFFPNLDWDQWHRESETFHEQDAKHPVSFRFQHYTKCIE